MIMQSFHDCSGNFHQNDHRGWGTGNIHCINYRSSIFSKVLYLPFCQVSIPHQDSPMQISCGSPEYDCLQLHVFQVNDLYF